VFSIELVVIVIYRSSLHSANSCFALHMYLFYDAQDSSAFWTAVEIYYVIGRVKGNCNWVRSHCSPTAYNSVFFIFSAVLLVENCLVNELFTIEEMW